MYHTMSRISIFCPLIIRSFFLIQEKTFQFSYPRKDFPVFLFKIRLSNFLIQDKNLTECMKEEKKAHTKTAPEFAVKNKNIFRFVNNSEDHHRELGL